MDMCVQVFLLFLCVCVCLYPRVVPMFMCPCHSAHVGVNGQLSGIDTLCCVHSRLNSERVDISLTEDIWPWGKWFVFSSVCVVWGTGT